MSDGSEMTSIYQGNTNIEHGTEIQLNQSQSIESGPSKIQNEFSSASNNNNYPVPSLNEIFPSIIPQSLCSTTVYNNIQCNLEPICDYYQLIERPVASHDESNLVSYPIESMPSILPPIGHMPLHEDYQTNPGVTSNYYQEREMLFSPNNESYTVSCPTETSPSTYQPMCSTSSYNDIQTDSGETDSYYRGTYRPVSSHNESNAKSNLTETYSCAEENVQFYKSSTSRDGTHDQSFYPNRTKISGTQEDASVRMQKKMNSIGETSIGQNVALSSTPGSPSLQQQSGYSREPSSMLQPQQQTQSLSVRPMLQDNGHENHTAQDASFLQSISDDFMDENHSVHFGNLGTSAGPSNASDLIQHCEPLNVETYRRPEDKQYVCPMCKNLTSNVSKFFYHFYTHTGEKPYSCDICEKKCRTKSHLKLHRKTHTGETPYICPFCEKILKNSQTGKNHIKTVHPEKFIQLHREKILKFKMLIP